MYYGSLNILAQLESAESMMAFRTKKTVNALIRYFGIDGIIKEYLSSQNTNSNTANQQQKQVNYSLPSTKQEKQTIIQIHPSITLQKADISNPDAIAKAFGAVEPGKDVRKKAQMRLWKLGNDAGFNAYIEYEVPNLLQDGVNRFISVVWKEGPEIKAAFQIRRKKRGMDQLTSLRDMNKLHMLPATEKYLVNISQKTGSPAFFKVNNSANISSLSTKPSLIKLEKSYSVDEIRLKYARAYESWAEAEENQLISEYKSKMPISAIAKKHQRQRNAIRSRLKKLIDRGLIQP